MDWKTEKSRFDSVQEREIFLHSVHTGSGVPLASYAGALSPRVKRGGGDLKLTTDFHLVVKLRMIGAVPPVCLRLYLVVLY